MKIIAGYLLTVVLAVTCTSTFAQAISSSIQGKVHSDRGMPVDSATVVLLNSRDSSVVRSVVTAKSGVFVFNQLQAGTYLVFITKLNYTKTYSGPCQLIAEQNLDIGFITIKLKARELDGVAITGKKDFVELKPDKTVLNLDQNIMATGSSLYDVLSTAPGVRVLNDDILYRGGQKALIAINGKPVLLSGEELANFLRNYQSSSISQIELIDNPPAKYEASGSGGMINIVLKKNKDVGSSASVSQSAAYGDKYKFNTSLNYNLRTNKLNFFANYNFTGNRAPHTILNNRNILSNGQLYNFDLNYNAQITSHNNSFNVGADYQLTPRQTIGFLFNGYDVNSTIGKKSNTNISTNGQPDSSINTLSTINRDIYNLNYNLNYKAAIGKSGKTTLAADLDYSDYHRSSNEDLQNDFFDATGQTDSESIFYHDNSPSHIKIRSENIDFTQMLSKSTHIEAGVKNSQVNSDNLIGFQQRTDTGDVNVSSLTDHFVYNEQINSAYLKLETKFNKTDLSFSLRGEGTNTTTHSINPERISDTSYFNLFPSVQLVQALDKNNTFTAFYTRNINRPNYQDLNPFVGYVDQFYYSTGNPFLKPSYVNTYQVSDLYLNKYKVSLSMVVTDNYFYTIFEQDDATKVYIVTKANLGTRYQYLAQFNIPIDITRWWNIDADLTAYHERYVYKNYPAAQKNTNGILLTLSQNFKLTSKLTAQVNSDYESPSYFAISQYQTLYYVNAGLKYSVLKNNGSIRLSVSDIFNSDMNQYHTSFSNLDITARDKIGSRFVQAAFTYHFGNLSIKAHQSKAHNEEIKRLSDSGNEN